MFGRGDRWKSLTFLSFYLPKFRVLEGGSLGVVPSQPAERNARRPEGRQGLREVPITCGPVLLSARREFSAGLLSESFFSPPAFVL